MAVLCDYCNGATATREVTSTDRRHTRYVCGAHQPAALDQLGPRATSTAGVRYRQPDERTRSMTTTSTPTTVSRRVPGDPVDVAVPPVWGAPAPGRAVLPGAVRLGGPGFGPESHRERPACRAAPPGNPQPHPDRTRRQGGRPMTSAPQRCDLTDLLVAQCAHCCGHTLPTDQPADLGPTFTARYAGICAGCGDQFDAGDQIRADGAGGYLCDDCGEESTR